MSSTPIAPIMAQRDALPGIIARTQDEGLPENAGIALAEVPAGIKGKVASGQARAFVTMSGAGESDLTLVDPAPASDPDQYAGLNDCLAGA